jgi:hypothetical protein
MATRNPDDQRDKHGLPSNGSPMTTTKTLLLLKGSPSRKV